MFCRQGHTHTHTKSRVLRSTSNLKKICQLVNTSPVLGFGWANHPSLGLPPIRHWDFCSYKKSLLRNHYQGEFRVRGKWRKHSTARFHGTWDGEWNGDALVLPHTQTWCWGRAWISSFIIYYCGTDCHRSVRTGIRGLSVDSQSDDIGVVAVVCPIRLDHTN